MKLTVIGRILAATFPVVAWFDETRADILTFEFHTQPRGADWPIGRDLITDGLTKPAGEMDIRMWPCPETDEVAIELCSPFGRAIIRLPWHPLATFIRATYDRVPAGTEYDGLDWEQLLTAAGGA
jgi:hypothetical protein